LILFFQIYGIILQDIRVIKTVWRSLQNQSNLFRSVFRLGTIVQIEI